MVRRVGTSLTAEQEQNLRMWFGLYREYHDALERDRVANRSTLLKELKEGGRSSRFIGHVESDLASPLPVHERFPDFVSWWQSLPPETQKALQQIYKERLGSVIERERATGSAVIRQRQRK
jgi:hypothetical protein